MRSNYFPGVQALRGLAAALVVWQHSAYTSGAIVHHFPYTATLPDIGRIGVVLFFAISGFVIALNRDKPVGQFIAHRLLRIYPPYWAAVLLGVILTSLGPARMRVSVEALLLLPIGTDPGIIIPYWTLVFEIVFYTLAALLFTLRASKHTLTIGALGWIAAVNLAAPLLPADFEPSFPQHLILLSPVIQVFPMGLLCALHVERLHRVNAAWLVIVALAAYAVGCLFDYPTAPRHLALGVAATAIVALGARARNVAPVLTRLGDASYGIYLLHFPVLITVGYVMPKLTLFTNALLLFPFGLIAGAAFGAAEYRVYRMMTARLKTSSAPDSRLHRSSRYDSDTQAVRSRVEEQA